MLIKAAEFIKPWEAFRSRSYKCPADVWTIGWGTTKGITANMVITEEEAQTLLMRDVAEAYTSLLRLTKAPLTETQIIALIDFIYNVGAGTYQRSSIRQCINRGDIEDAPTHILKYIYGGGRILKGLVKRRAAEAQLFTS